MKRERPAYGLTLTNEINLYAIQLTSCSLSGASDTRHTNAITLSSSGYSIYFQQFDKTSSGRVDIGASYTNMKTIGSTEVGGGYMGEVDFFGNVRYDRNIL
jgi:hypothetical protein